MIKRFSGSATILECKKWQIAHSVVSSVFLYRLCFVIVVVDGVLSVASITATGVVVAY